MNRIIVTGGCGFIGTQVVRRLKEAGHHVTVVDWNVTDWEGGPADQYYQEDYKDFFYNFSVGDFDTVVHLAAEHLVGPSVTEPEQYYTSNVVGMKIMLDSMLECDVKNIIFSSSGNVYGRQGLNGTLTEDLYYDPENPYASTKVAGELLLKDYSRAYGINAISFRYFNAVGADPECRNGYVQTPATHVMPIICDKIDKGEPLTVYGCTYRESRDGSCIRDYIHIDDLANAHVLAVDCLDKGGKSTTLNLGGGKGGVSVFELADIAEETIGKPLNLKYGEPRAGDPVILTADITKAKEILGWEPKYSIKECVQHAWAWHKKYNG